MIFTRYYHINSLVLIVAILASKLAYANIDVGYGVGKEVDENYNNTVVTLSLYPKAESFRANPKLYFNWLPHYSYWRADTEENKESHIFGYALNGKGYFFEPGSRSVAAYVNIHFGPIWMTNNYLGERHLGSHIALATLLATGFEWQISHKYQVDFRVGFLHLCNAGLASPNKSFNLPLLFQIGLKYL